MNKEKEELFKQLDDNQDRQNRLKAELLKLPKGHVNILYRNSKGYYYLTYRDGQKIRNDYLGPVGKVDLEDTFALLNEREQLSRQLRALRIEEKQLKKKAGRRRNVPQKD